MIDAQVLIVGAGPTGLAMACSLGQQGIRCRIVDKASAPAQESRALAIQARSLEVFDRWGIVDDFLARGLPIYGLRLFGEEKQQLAHLEFSGLPTRFPFVLSLPQRETEEILTKHVQDLGYTIERDVRVAQITSDSEGVTASLEKPSGETEQARFQWIVGCDGAHSTVRNETPIAFRGKDYPQQFMLADAHIDWPMTPHEAYVYASADGLLACFPLPGGTYRIVADKQVSGDLKTPPGLEEVQSILAARGPGDARVVDLLWSANFFIHARLVEALQSGRMFLVGDAAHIHSPALAQGMNTGIQDADNLAWKLALVCKGSASSALLESYGLERWPVERRVLSQTDFVTNVMSGRNRFLAWLRDHVGPIIVSNDAVSHNIKELVSELAIDYSDSPFLLQEKSDASIKPGERAPDVPLRCNQAEKRLFELLRGPGHHLLVFSDKPRDIDPGNFVPDELTVHPIRRKADDPSVVTDSLGRAADVYGWERAYLIRPDGYVGATCLPDAIEATLAEYVTRIRAQVASIRDKVSIH